MLMRDKIKNYLPHKYENRKTNSTLALFLIKFVLEVFVCETGKSDINILIGAL